MSLPAFSSAEAVGVGLALRAARADLEHLVLDLGRVIGAGRLGRQRDEDRAVVVVRREDRVDARRRELRDERVRHTGRRRGRSRALDAGDDGRVARGRPTCRTTSSACRRRCRSAPCSGPTFWAIISFTTLPPSSLKPMTTTASAPLPTTLRDVGVEVGRGRVVGALATTVGAAVGERCLQRVEPKPVPYESFRVRIATFDLLSPRMSCASAGPWNLSGGAVRK